MLEAPRFERGFTTAVVDLDRTLRLRAENTTWRDDLHDVSGRSSTCPTRWSVPAAEFSTEAQRATLAYPVPAHKSFFLPADHPVADCAGTALRGNSRRAGAWGWGLLREEPGFQGHRDLAFGRTGFAADAAGGAPICQQGAAGRSGIADPGVLSTVAVFVAGDADGGGDDLRRSGGAADDRVDRRRLRARDAGGAGDAATRGRR